MSYDLSDYVDVKTRLVQALDKYPQLRITEHRPVPVQVGDQIMIECAVTVARDPDDPVPVTAYMYEPFPGRTPYTKLSEQANGATSALGRALGYMGFGITASLASANEVRNRQEQPSRVDQIEDRRQAKVGGNARATQGQITLITTMAAEREIDVTDVKFNDITFEEAQSMIAHFKTIAKIKK
jgi:hypothetical protein